MLGLGIVMEAGASICISLIHEDMELGFFHDWEEPGLLTALQDK